MRVGCPCPIFRGGAKNFFQQKEAHANQDVKNMEEIKAEQVHHIL